MSNVMVSVAPRASANGCRNSTPTPMPFNISNGTREWSPDQTPTRSRCPSTSTWLTCSERVASGAVVDFLVFMAFRLYASPAYLGRRRAVDLAHDAFVGFDESLANTPPERWLG